jgi:hypothetical protein
MRTAPKKRGAHSLCIKFWTKFYICKNPPNQETEIAPVIFRTAKNRLSKITLDKFLNQKIYMFENSFRINAYKNGLIILSFASTRRLCFMSSV